MQIFSNNFVKKVFFVFFPEKSSSEMMKNTIKGTIIRLSRKGTIPTRYASNVVIYRLRVPN